MIAGQIINGLVMGTMYALVALGFTLVLGVLHRLNLAHGDIFVLGGFVGLGALNWGMPAWLTIPLAVVVGGAAGIAVEQICFRRLKTQDAEMAAALSSVAFGIVVLDLVHKVWGTEPVALDVSALGPITGVDVAGVRFTSIQMVIAGITIGLMIGLHLLVSRTRLGRNIRAVADNAQSSSLLGVNVAAVTRQVFMISSALGCVAGLLLTLRLGTVSTDLGFSFALKALAVMAIGGLGDLRGAVFGGLLIGVIEALAAQFGFGRLADLTVWLCMVAFLVFRPKGLFGSAAVTETRA
jgi:branched-chain amino acid transport system permease protein